jgi:hypothetical protein
MEGANPHFLSVIPQFDASIIGCGLIIGTYRPELKDDMISSNAYRIVRHAKCSTEMPPGRRGRCPRERVGAPPYIVTRSSPPILPTASVRF